jgi:hypothetical protein
MSQDQRPDATIAEVFDPEDIAARFTVAMGMAKNDIERALRDVADAGQKDRPDFSYRVRLVVGHLVEALDSLNAYTQASEDVRRLTKRVPTEGQKMLSKARGTAQAVGSDALDHTRNHTFHYPSPKTNYSPTSDEHLRDTLAAMGDRRADIHVDYDTKHVTFTFSDEVALALSMGKHAPEPEEVRKQFERTRDGALAFVAWAERLLIAFFDSTGAEFGDPEVSEKP